MNCQSSDLLRFDTETRSFKEENLLRAYRRTSHTKYPIAYETPMEIHPVSDTFATGVEGEKLDNPSFSSIKKYCAKEPCETDVDVENMKSKNDKVEKIFPEVLDGSHNTHQGSRVALKKPRNKAQHDAIFEMLRDRKGGFRDLNAPPDVSNTNLSLSFDNYDYLVPLSYHWRRGLDSGVPPTDLSNLRTQHILGPQRKNDKGSKKGRTEEKKRSTVVKSQKLSPCPILNPIPDTICSRIYQKIKKENPRFVLFNYDDVKDNCENDSGLNSNENNDDILWQFEIDRIKYCSRMQVRHDDFVPPSTYGDDVYGKRLEITKKVHDLPTFGASKSHLYKERESDRLKRKISELEQESPQSLTSYKLPKSPLFSDSVNLPRNSDLRVQNPRPFGSSLRSPLFGSNHNELRSRQSSVRWVTDSLQGGEKIPHDSKSGILKTERKCTAVEKFSKLLQINDQSINHTSVVFSDSSDLNKSVLDDYLDRTQETKINDRNGKERRKQRAVTSVASSPRKKLNNVQNKRCAVISCRNNSSTINHIPGVITEVGSIKPNSGDIGSGHIYDADSRSGKGDVKVELMQKKKGKTEFNEIDRHGNAKNKETEKEDEIRKSLKFVMSFYNDLENFTAEKDTMMPPQEIHLYQIYCYNTNKVIIFRPISPAAPGMYAGNFFVPSKYCDDNGIPLMVDEISEDMCFEDVQAFTTGECRIKGKGISVSLKSSPYPPIEGFIPVNPGLSKTYSESKRKERILEDSLLYATDRISTSLLKKIRFQRNMFKAATSVAMKDIVMSLSKSEEMLNEILHDYQEVSAMSIQKEEISLQYIDTLNESQFLGKTVATWRGMELYYKRLTDDLDIERTSDGSPIFYVRKDAMLYVYNPATNELNMTSEYTRRIVDEASSMCPVYVLTHRSFVISPISKRIEPDPNGDFIIGPDFDGFAYASGLPDEQYTDADAYGEFCEKRLNIRLKPSMGIVSPLDEEHILEVRALTEWKQNHGYECSNIVKTQEITDGPHLVVLPNMTIRCLYNFSEIIRFYREAWQKGYPLLLNPNWKVVLDPVTYMPVVYGSDISMPIVGDCGMAMITHTLSVTGKNVANVKNEATRYIEETLAQKKKSSSVFRILSLVSHQDIVLQMAIVIGQKALAEKFFRLRQWLLMSPHFLHHLLKKCYYSSDGMITSDPSDSPLRRGERGLDVVYDDAYFETTVTKLQNDTSRNTLQKTKNLESSTLDSTYNSDGSLLLLQDVVVDCEIRRQSVSSSFRRKLSQDYSNMSSSRNYRSSSSSSRRDLSTKESTAESSNSYNPPSTMYIIPVSAEFEEFRNGKIEPLLKEFNESCADFDLVFGRECEAFTNSLKMYVNVSDVFGGKPSLQTHESNATAAQKSQGN